MTRKSYNARLAYHEDPEMRETHRKLKPIVHGLKRLPHAYKMATKKAERAARAA